MLSEHFGCKMGRTTDAGRSKIAFARISFEIGDERLEILYRIVGANDQIEGNARNGRDRDISTVGSKSISRAAVLPLKSTSS